MAVWTTGSARGENALWIWLKRRLSRQRRPVEAPLDEMPDALRADVAAVEEPLPRPKDDLWARISAAKLPRP